MRNSGRGDNLEVEIMYNMKQPLRVNLERVITYQTIDWLLFTNRQELLAKRVSRKCTFPFDMWPLAPNAIAKIARTWGNARKTLEYALRIFVDGFRVIGLLNFLSWSTP